MKESKRKALKKYKQTKTASFGVELYPTDEDIKRRIKERVEAGEPRTTYIKRLIREDIAKSLFQASVMIYNRERTEDVAMFAVVDEKHEVAKQEAYEQIAFICKSYGVPAGELYIEVQITQDGEYIDGDEFTAMWNGETISAE